MRWLLRPLIAIGSIATAVGAVVALLLHLDAFWTRCANQPPFPCALDMLIHKTSPMPKTQPPPEPPAPGPQATKRPFRVVDVSDGFLQIRNGPGPTYQETAKMPLGAIALVGRCVPVDGWKPIGEVEWQGVSGWASSCCMAELEKTTYRVTQNLSLRRRAR
jgi:hypothetical protein